MTTGTAKQLKGQQKITRLGLRIGWKGDVTLLRQALTHPTFFEGQKQPGQVDNQRLEFLGDAVLDMLIGEELYKMFPECQEGELSKMRASLVCEGALAEVARDLELGSYLLLGKGALRSGDNQRDSVLADAMEAIIGAMYLTHGVDAVRNFLLVLMDSDLQDLLHGKSKFNDYKGQLQQWAQAGNLEWVTYRLLDSSGPDHARNFVIGCFCGKVLLAKGQGGSKKEAEQHAAEQAWLTKDEWVEKLIKKTED